jgi:hypothetical protein
MTIQYVTVVCDLGDGQGNYLTSGTGYLSPSATLTDSTDHLIAGGTPVVPVAFKAGTTPPSVKLIATDNGSILPDGWAWSFTPPSVSSVAAFSFLLPAGPVSFTATDASPCVFTTSATSYVNGTSVTLAGDSLPAGFTAGTTYYVTGASGFTFQLAATPGGEALASTSTGSGSVTTTSVYLSALAPVSSGTAFQAYMPLPSGTPSAGQVPVATGSGEASAWGSGGGGSGTVTSVSVESANGLAGTVADDTTTPQITLSTTVTGLLKGDGTAVSEATAGTDYLTPSGSGADLTGITAAQAGASPDLQLVYLDDYGSDPTGADYSDTAMAAAQSAGGSGAYRIILGAGTYKLADAYSFGRQQGVTGPGGDVCLLSYTGNSVLFSVFDSDFSSADSVGGRFGGFRIDGTDAGDDAIGMAWGNMLYPRCRDIRITSCPGGGLYLKNTTAGAEWSERGEWTAIYLGDNGGYQVCFDTGSFDYAVYQFVLDALANQNGVQLQNNASLEGVRAEVRGNFHAGETNTGAVFAFDPAAEAGTGESRIDGAEIYVNVECDGSSGLGHYTISAPNAGSTSQFTGTGVLQFNDETVDFQGLDVASEFEFGFAGRVYEHTTGFMSPGDGLAVQGGSLRNEFGSLTTALPGTIYLKNADFQAYQLASGNNDIVFGSIITRIRVIDLLLAQPSSGSAGTVTWPGGTVWAGGAAPSLSPVNGAVDRVRLTYRPSAGIWYGEYLGPQGSQAPWLPGDNGLLLANGDPALMTGKLLTKSDIYLIKLIARANVQVSNLWFITNAAGSGASTGSYVGAYSSGGSQIFESTDVATEFTTQEAFSVALGADAFVMTAGEFFWAAVVSNLASTQVTLGSYPGGNLAQAAQIGTTVSGYRWGLYGTGTSLPGSITPADITSTGAFLWAGAS